MEEEVDPRCGRAEDREPSDQLEERGRSVGERTLAVTMRFRDIRHPEIILDESPNALRSRAAQCVTRCGEPLKPR